MTEIQQMQHQLSEALGRIQHLEEEIGSGKESPRWQYLIARPHRWRRQLCIKGRNMTVGQLVSTVRANGYTPEQASGELELPLAAIHEALTYVRIIVTRLVGLRRSLVSFDDDLPGLGRDDFLGAAAENSTFTSGSMTRRDRSTQTRW